MANLIGGRELCDAMGLEWDSLADRQKVAVFLNRNHVPFISIGSNRRGNTRGLLIDAEALHSIIWRRHEDRRNKERGRKPRPEGQAPIGASPEGDEQTPKWKRKLLDLVEESSSEEHQGEGKHR